MHNSQVINKFELSYNYTYKNMAENKDNFVNLISKRKWTFLWYFVVVSTLTFTFLYLIDWVPAALKNDGGESFNMVWDRVVNNSTSTANIVRQVSGEKPTRVVASEVGLDTIVSNPNTIDVQTLDDYLLHGAVRYPGSGLAGSGNMFIFAHSTGFKVVNNQAYKTFNGIKNFKTGDEIKVYTEGKVFLYKVTTVRMADASEVLVKFDTTRNMLTLSTCNSFGEKSQRYVVEAELE